MSYYSKKYNRRNKLDIGEKIIFGIVILIFILMCNVNSCSASVWNDGVCQKCKIRYELSGISDGFRYYSCPKCGQEVIRFLN